MAVTRSGRMTGKTAKKIKFSEDGDAPVEVVSVSDKDSTVEPESKHDVEVVGKEDAYDVEDSEGVENAEDVEIVDSTSESDSDLDSDEAPEEESVSQSKAAVLSKMKEQEKLEHELRKQGREKRRQRDFQFKQQQDAKRERIKKFVDAEQLPDLLPAEALEPDEEGETSSKNSRKHLRSEDFEKESVAMRKKAKLEKLQNLKALRSQALKKGPVYVQVQYGLTSKNRVPRAEAIVLDTKKQWFQRESLKRK